MLKLTTRCVSFGVGLFLMGVAASAEASAEGGPPVAQVPWRHWTTPALVTSQGAPVHHVADVAIQPGSPITLSGKFAYGRFAKDLEDEQVSVWLRPSGERSWKKVSEGLTSSGGSYRVELDASVLDAVREAEFQMVVGGDLSRATGTIRVVAAGQRSVVFDIDGTLTLADSELWEELWSGNEADPHPGAAGIAWLYSQAGFQIFYLTGRPDLLSQLSKDWLVRRGFPPGIVRTTDRLVDASPTESYVQKYKRKALQAWVKTLGVRYAVVYGNAMTDVCAYAQAGIDPRTTFIIGPNAGAACHGHAPTRPVMDYLRHREEAKQIIEKY